MINKNNQLPPRAQTRGKRRVIRSKGHRAQPNWDDNFVISSGIPEYKAYNNDAYV